MGGGPDSCEALPHPPPHAYPRLFAQANDLLRQDGLRAGMERFGVLAALLFLRQISAQQDGGQEAAWGDLAGLPGDALLDRLRRSVPPSLARAAALDSALPDALATLRQTTVRTLVERLSTVPMRSAEGALGSAFEWHLRHAASVGNDLGEYYTPPHIVELMVGLVNPQPHESVYDPCCGVGGLLAAAHRHGAHQGRRSPSSAPLIGRELTATAGIAGMRLLLAGAEHVECHSPCRLSNSRF